MSSNRTEARSIATQLVLLFTLCAALLLCCGFGIFYWIVVRHAFEEDSVVFADKVDTLPDDVIVRYATNNPTYADFRRLAGFAINRAVRSRRLADAGVSAAKFAAILA